VDWSVFGQMPWISYTCRLHLKISRGSTVTLLKFAFIFVLVIPWLLSCGAKEENSVEEPASMANVVEVRAIYDTENNLHLFETDTQTIPSGWTTIRLINASPMVHFLFLDHLPGERTSKELMSEVSPIFQQASDLIAKGRVEEGNAIFSELPTWFSDLVFRGGPGYVSPGQTTEVTLFLTPGNYVMECYIKTADGIFHWNLGMYADLLVTNEESTGKPPTSSTLKLTTSDQGIEFEGNPTPGEHMVAVHFQQETPTLVAHDVQLVRLEEDSDFEEIVNWLDFMQPTGLISTAESPAPAVFLGGVHEMPMGNVAYFPVTLTPGEYAWISEQPIANAAYVKFSVPAFSKD